MHVAPPFGIQYHEFLHVIIVPIRGIISKSFTECKIKKHHVESVAVIRFSFRIQFIFEILNIISGNKRKLLRTQVKYKNIPFLN